MKNLNPIGNGMRYWDNIVASKIISERRILTRERAHIQSRFSNFNRRADANTLDLIADSQYTGRLRRSLLDCYENGTNSLDNLKTAIATNQGDLLMSLCQYCTIGIPNTFDHYLPKEFYSEFSAFSNNLLPCCPTCNNTRGSRWIDNNGSRNTINFYFDGIPNRQFLFCDVNVSGSVTTATFRLNTLVLPVQSRNLISNHYSSLHLLQRFREAAPREIADVKDSLPRARISRIQLKNILLDIAAKKHARWGANYWPAILRTTLANSNDFLRSIGY